MSTMPPIYPGCPTLAWMIAKRVTNPYEKADAFISFTGRKGSSKTTSSSALAEDIAENIARLRGKGEKASDFFTIANVRSITELGALELLSSGALQKENSVFLLDDTGTQWNARNFQSPINKTLNSILQICRIYRCVIIANFILQSHIDVGARGMADFRAEMLYKNPREGYAVFRFFYLEQGTKRGKPWEYKKYLKFHGKRIKQWVIERPSDEYEAAYQKIRQDNTDEYVATAKAKVAEILAKQDPATKGAKPYSEDKRLRDYSVHPKILAIQDKVREIRNDQTLSKQERSDNAIARKLGETRYWIGMVK